MLLNTCLLLLTPSTHQTHFCSSKSIFSLFILGWIFLIDQARPPLSGLFKSSNNMTTIIPRHSLVISPGFVPYRNSQSMRTKCLVVCVLTVRPSQENVNPLTAERPSQTETWQWGRMGHAGWEEGFESGNGGIRLENGSWRSLNAWQSLWDLIR